MALLNDCNHNPWPLQKLKYFSARYLVICVSFAVTTATWQVLKQKTKIPSPSCMFYFCYCIMLHNLNSSCVYVVTAIKHMQYFMRFLISVILITSLLFLFLFSVMLQKFESGPPTLRAKIIAYDCLNEFQPVSFINSKPL